MMKFIFFMAFSLPLYFLCNIAFWVVSVLVLMLGVCFLVFSLTGSDVIFLGGGLFLDGLSFSLILLSFWITVLMYFSSVGVYLSKNNISYFCLMLYLLCLVLVLTFSSFNLLAFYFYFEFSLLPTLFIILGWGYQPERLQAGLYFLFYTLTASLPLLIVLVYLYNKVGGLDFSFLVVHYMTSYSLFLFFCFTFAFLVKMPMFFTHLWLPKAHVEAPVAGSMILAGVLLKLGGYGFYRIMGFCQGGLLNFGGYIFGLSILGMMYVGFICCRLNDLKALVAYSSVAHMALVICGVYSFSFWGYTGALMMMLSHGLASSGLFCIVNMYYERSGSRSLFLNKGLILVFPLFCLFMFMLCGANMAAPPTINLLSEIFSMVSILNYDSIMLVIFPLASYLGAVFTLYLFSFSQHGKISMSTFGYFCPVFREYHVLTLHLFPVNFLILKSEFFMFIY